MPTFCVEVQNNKLILVLAIQWMLSSFGMCYVQSMDCDNSQIVLRKPQIQASHSQSVDCLRAYHHSISSGHMYTDWMTAHHKVIDAKWQETQEQCAKKEPDKGNKILLALRHSTNRCALCRYY